MRKFVKILLGAAVLFGITFSGILFLTSGEREIARNFVLLASSGSISQAHQLLQSGLQKTFTQADLGRAFKNVRPYTEVSFSKVETSGSGTQLEGVARTSDGCASQVRIEVLEGAIISFDIAPLCYRSTPMPSGGNP